jgi:NTP pyrophosphatase (non-canonical NTP hydrolase)
VHQLGEGKNPMTKTFQELIDAIEEESCEPTIDAYHDWVDGITSPRVREMGMNYLARGLMLEAAEVCDLWHKIDTKRLDITEDHEDKFLDELGDVLWFLTGICNYFDFSLDELMQYNISKLEERNSDPNNHKNTHLIEPEKQNETD